MRDLFIGSEALTAGWLTRAELRSCHTRILPDVYAPQGKSLSFRDLTAAAWLWSQRQGSLRGKPPLRPCTARSGWTPIPPSS